MIWLSSPHPSGNEQKYIDEAFNLRRLFAFGENINGFENDLENYLGQGVYVAAFNSGTSAIHMALILLGVANGDEVICQSLTFAASANPILYLGAKPLFVGSEPQTWNMCPDALESAIKDRIAKGKKPKAIIAVHLYGMPYKADEINEVAKKYDIPVIEDSAEALGSQYKGVKCGTLGDISILSFNGNKIITTASGGGLVSKNPKVKERAIFLASQAKDPAPHYQHSQVGYNYRISNINAGIGRGQIEVLQDYINLRRKNNIFYSELFSGESYIKLLKEPDADFYSNYWLTTLTMNDSNKTSEALRLFLAKVNIETRPVWKPLHLQPVFESCDYYGDNCAEDVFNTGLCLPSGSNLTDNEKQRITDAFTAWKNTF